jgi:SNF2 family DNA or RNA helicase
MSVTPLIKPLPSWPMHAYQEKAIKLMLGQAAAGLFLDPGLGKTSITLAAFSILRSKGLVGPMLVISPLKPMYNSWPGEIDKWADFAHLKYAILHGKEREDYVGSDADVFLINPEGLDWFFGVRSVGGKVIVNLDRLRRTQASMLVVDESTKFKSYSSKRFKILRQVVGKFARRYILTGTPSPNGLMDLFGQVYILDEGAALGRFITHYRTAYFYPDHTGFNWLPQHGALERITERVAPLTLRMEADDYLELPELTINRIFVDLPPAARKVYQRMEDELIVQLSSQEIVASNEAVASGKCRQIAGGALYRKDVLGKQSYEVLHEEKLDALENLMDELSGQPLLVFYEFDFERELISSRLPGLRVLGKSPKHDTEYIRLFNAGAIPGLLAQTSSAALGLNLQAACANVCFYTATWKWDDNKQGIDRVRRQGNPFLRVIAHYLIARDTIDEIVFARVQRKGKDELALGRALAALRDQR